jgi:hypothetical protein
MKAWIITALTLIGGYAVFQWLTHQQGLPKGQRASAGASVNLGSLGVSLGIQSNIDPISSGVPEYNTTPIANGHGDQVTAAYHTGPGATLPGSANYTPAFGPNENQMQPGETTVGLV